MRYTEHQWKEQLDALGFVDERKCSNCKTEEIRENMPGHKGEWHQRNYSKTPKCFRTLTIPPELDNFFRKMKMRN